MKVAFVVLHYISLDDTFECVDSICNNIVITDGDKKYVIIVDNGSPNNTYIELNKKYKNIDNIYILKSDKNLGFAKGNNLGYQYAKYQLKADFIILLNNDTIITQTDFISVIEKKYYKNKYAVLGPDIITEDGFHQNPGKKQTWELGELKLFRMKKRARLLLNYLHLDKMISYIIRSIKDIYNEDCYIGDIENTVLHGSCLIFSPLYIKNFDGLHDETFLYMEEDILKLYADFYHFKMMYTSELYILHKEDAATNASSENYYQKMKSYYKNLIASSKVYSRLKSRMRAKEKFIYTIEKQEEN